MVRREKEKAQKIKDFPCKTQKNQAFRISIFFDILTDSYTSRDIFGHNLGTMLVLFLKRQAGYSYRDISLAPSHFDVTYSYICS